MNKFDDVFRFVQMSGIDRASTNLKVPQQLSISAGFFISWYDLCDPNK